MRTGPVKKSFETHSTGIFGLHFKTFSLIFANVVSFSYRTTIGSLDFPPYKALSTNARNQKKKYFFQLGTFLHMVWTKYHMASTTEKCGRAKFTSSHSSKACLVHKNLTWTFLKFSNSIDQTMGNNCSWWRPPSQASFLHKPLPQLPREQGPVQLCREALPEPCYSFRFLT